MSRKLLFFVIIILACLLWTESELWAQTSPQDTLKFVTVQGLPGDTVEMVLALANGSTPMASINVQFSVDTNLIKPVVTIDGANQFIDFTLLDMAGFSYANSLAWYFQFFPEEQVGRGLFVQDYEGDVVELPQGHWNLLSIKFKISEDAPLGDSTPVTLFSVYTGAGIIITFYDETGIEGVEPTLVPGYVKFGSGPTPNNPPVISPLASPINVSTGSPVSFAVNASDPEGKTVTLTAQNLPSGASFTPSNPVTGTGSVSGTFNWPSAQSGTYNVTFRAVDDLGAIASRTVTINVEAVLTDNLFVASTKSLGIQGGIPGTPGIPMPINLQDIRDVYGVQFDLVYDQNVCRLDSITPTERLAGFTIHDNIGTTPGRLRIVTFGADNEVIVPGPGGLTIMNIWVTIRTTAEAGNYPFKIVEAWESINPDPNSPSVALAYDTLGLLAVDMLGDVNLRPPIDVADLVSLVGYIIGDWSFTERHFRAADINSDAQANVIDLVAILNYILAGGASPAPFAAVYNGPDAGINIEGGEIGMGQSALLKINADLPVEAGGVQLEINYDPEKIELDRPLLVERTDGLYFRHKDDGHGRLIIIMHYKSQHDGTISAGVGEILNIPIRALDDISSEGENAAINLNDAVVSTPEGAEIPVRGFSKPIPSRFELAQNYPNPFNPFTTIGFEVLPAPNHPGSVSIELVVYNILGQKVKTLASGSYLPGQYSVIWDGTDNDGNPQASGIYFYSLLSGDSRVTKKMVLTK